jgi:hypothetical protein
MCVTICDTGELSVIVLGDPFSFPRVKSDTTFDIIKYFLYLSWKMMYIIKQFTLHFELLGFLNLSMARYSEQNAIFWKVGLFPSSGVKVGRHVLR